MRLIILWKWGWSKERNWEAIGAIAEVIAATAMIATVFYAYKTVTEANEDAASARQDAETNRVQQAKLSKDTETNQLTRFQGLVMSQCIQEYFGIRSEAAKNWRQSTNSDDQQEVQELYSERMYGLHFEEYHLFRQDIIPTHVYRVWIKSFRNEALPPRH